VIAVILLILIGGIAGGWGGDIAGKAIFNWFS
jgi:hypothetical protein